MQLVNRLGNDSPLQAALYPYLQLPPAVNWHDLHRGLVRCLQHCHVAPRVCTLVFSF